MYYMEFHAANRRNGEKIYEIYIISVYAIHNRLDDAFDKL